MPGVHVDADAAMSKSRDCEKPDAASSDDSSLHAAFCSSSTKSMHHDGQWLDKSDLRCPNIRGDRYQAVVRDDYFFG
jgi:hypothetical protein